MRAGSRSLPRSHSRPLGCLCSRPARRRLSRTCHPRYAIPRFAKRLPRCRIFEAFEGGYRGACTATPTMQRNSPFLLGSLQAATAHTRRGHCSGAARLYRSFDCLTHTRRALGVRCFACRAAAEIQHQLRQPWCFRTAPCSRSRSQLRTVTVRQIASYRIPCCGSVYALRVVLGVRARVVACSSRLYCVRNPQSTRWGRALLACSPTHTRTPLATDAATAVMGSRGHSARSSCFS